MPVWSGRIVRFASIRLCIAEPRQNLDWYSVSTAEETAAALPIGLPRAWHDDDPQPSVHALCYVVDRGHRQYAGRLSLQEQLHFARQGHGRSGACRDYVLAATKELQALGIRDQDLQVLADQLRGIHESAAR